MSDIVRSIHNIPKRLPHSLKTARPSTGSALSRKRSNSLSVIDASNQQQTHSVFASQLNLADPRPPTKRDEKVIVYIRVIFMKIGEIDTVKECFNADAFIQAKWREPTLDGKIDCKPDEIKWSDFWHPNLNVVNTVGDPKETVWHTIMFNSEGEAYVCERKRIKGTFLENLELGEFPFDTQDLTLTIASERSVEEVELEEDVCELSSINVESFVDEQEWKLYRYVITTRKIKDGALQGPASKHSTLSSTCRASRRVGFFIWNIFFVMFFICSMTFSTFSVNYSLPQNRLQLAFILLLTNITFKYTVNQSLPKISYLTYLDYYIISSMVTIGLVCMWHALVASVIRSDDDNDEDDVSWIDRWVLISFGAVYIGGHIVLILLIVLYVLRKRRVDRRREREHNARIQMLSDMSRSVQLDLSQQSLQEYTTNKF